MATEYDNELLGNSLSISEARNQLTQLPERLIAEKRAIPLTRRGEPVMALVSWELYTSIIETMEIMADPKMMSALRENVEDIESGRVYTQEEVMAELDSEERLGALMSQLLKKCSRVGSTELIEDSMQCRLLEHC